jgi:hypothetical protein
MEANNFADVRWWAASLLKEARNYLRDLNLLTPWAIVPVTNLSLTGRELDAAINWRSFKENCTACHRSLSCQRRPTGRWSNWRPCVRKLKRVRPEAHRDAALEN